MSNRKERVKKEMLAKRQKLIQTRKQERLNAKHERMVQKALYPGITIRNNHGKGNEAQFSASDLEELLGGDTESTPGISSSTPGGDEGAREHAD